MHVLGQLYNQYKNNEKLKIRLLPTMTSDLAKINNIYVKKLYPFINIINTLIAYLMHVHWTKNRRSR